MIIPNTSTMEEEYIEVPFGRDRDVRGSGSTTTAEDRDRRDTSQERGYDNEPDSASVYPSPSPRSPPGGLSGLSGLSARLRSVDDDSDVGGKSPDDFYDRDRASVSRASISSDRSAGGITSRLAAAGKSTTTAEQDKIRRDYELKIATMQTQITNLQRDLEDSQQEESKLHDNESKAQQLEEELMTFRKVNHRIDLPMFSLSVLIYGLIIES